MILVRDLCRGKWRGILPMLGVSASFLTGKQMPCPVCGGKDRWRFTDKDAHGMSFCNQCGGMDGIKLVQLVNGWDFRRTASEIEAVVGDVAASKPKLERDLKPFMRKLWLESFPIKDTPASRYLESRGLEAPKSLHFHPTCPLKGYGLREAMLAPVRDPSGNGVAIHRTYLDGPKKANIESPRQVLGKLPPGSAIRLYEATDILGVAEGIESAIGAKMCFGVPTWACISNGGIERFVLPDTVKSLYIFGDSDANFVGQASAYALAARVRRKSPSVVVSVHIPDLLGADWADVAARQLNDAAMRGATLEGDQ